jgi:hypothetical protein
MAGRTKRQVQKAKRTTGHLTTNEMAAAPGFA